MKLEGFAVITELDQRQQERFIEQLERYKNDSDIAHGIELALTLLGYVVINSESEE